MEEDIEMMCVQLITSVGSARSCYIEAIQNARNGDMEKAKACMEEGRAFFKEGHDVHGDLHALDSEDKIKKIPMMLLHAEDQLMSAEGFGILAEEFLELYKKLGN